MGQSIAALDLGTSKSSAIVAKKELGGKFSISRIEKLPSKNAIRRGRIYNSEEVSEIISRLIRNLNSNPDTMQVEKFYVGIGGQSLHTHLFEVERPIDGGTINQPLLDSIEEEAKNYTPDFEENLGVASREYYADGHWAQNPKGTIASVIKARYQLIVGNPSLKRNLKTVLNNKGVSVVDYFISPLATAEAALTSEEKESGCALIEFGEGVTYVSVYKNKALKYMATLPIGGLAITKDIRSLNVSENEAETLKIEHGSALSESTAGSDVFSISDGSNALRTIERKELNRIIEARVNEIIKNVWSQIQNSGYAQALNAGIVITGGGALLRDLPQYIRNETGKEVRLADAKAWINPADKSLSPADSCVIGLAMQGKENCVKEPITADKEKEPTIFKDEEVESVKPEDKKPKKPGDDKKPVKPHGPGIIKKGWNNIKDLFQEVADNVLDEAESDNNKEDNTANKQ